MGWPQSDVSKGYVKSLRRTKAFRDVRLEDLTEETGATTRSARAGNPLRQGNHLAKTTVLREPIVALLSLAFQWPQNAAGRTIRAGITKSLSGQR